jgi:hypothetical protein
MTMQIAVSIDRTGLRHNPAHTRGKNFTPTTSILLPGARKFVPSRVAGDAPVALISASLPCFL